MSASICRISWLVLGAFLAACGGGGGGGGGGDDPPQRPPPSGPSGPPSIPAVNYQGASGPADLNSANAGAMADALYATFIIPFDLAELGMGRGLAPPGEVIDQVQAGPNGGSVHWTGRTAANGLGWTAGRFTGYRDGDDTIDGLLLDEFLQGPSPSNGQRHEHRVSFSDLRIRAPDADLTLGGTLTLILTGGTSDRSVTGSALVRDNETGLAFYAQNINITRPVAVTGNHSLSGSGRVFDSRYGYVDVQADEPWHFRINESIPHHGAPWRGVGLNGRHVQVTPLTPDVASVEYVGAGATEPNFAARVRWSDDFESQTTRQLQSAPTADGGASRSERPGATVVLDSRFTSHPQSAFVSSKWTLLFRPPGSVAALDDEQITRPSITLDVEGRYVIGIEVSDGVRTDRDVIALMADASMSPLFGPLDAQLTPDERVSGPANVAIDLSQVRATSFEEGMSLTLNAESPNGFFPSLTQTGPKSATLQANLTGVYELIWSSGGNSSSDQRIRDLKWIAVNAPMPYTPGGAFFLGGGEPGGIASGDLNADGFADLVVTMKNGANNAVMHLFYGNADRMLDPPVTLPVSTAGAVAIADVSSDGRVDIVLSTGLGMGMLLQTQSGAFGGELSIPGNCFLGGGERDFEVADLNGDGRLDVASHGCFGELDYYLQSSTGGLQPPEAVSAEEVDSLSRLAADDLNGDGVADVVVSARSFGAAPTFFVMYGVRGGLPGAPVPLPYQPQVILSTASAVALADINRDGRLDVIAGENPHSNGVDLPRRMTFLQEANGSFAAPTFSAAGPGGTRELVALDMNRDGALDLVTAGPFAGLNVYYGGPFASGVTSDSRPAALPKVRYAFPEAVLDLNRDGLMDFAYLTFDGRRVVLGVALGWDD